MPIITSNTIIFKSTIFLKKIKIILKKYYLALFNIKLLNTILFIVNIFYFQMKSWWKEWRDRPASLETLLMLHGEPIFVIQMSPFVLRNGLVQMQVGPSNLELKIVNYETSIISGITSFDNIGLAMLTVFQCVTMENWVPILYAVMLTISF